jgi:cobalamin biosynthesis protein CobT
LIVFKSFDEPMSETVRKRMSGMPAEVEDGNPGGHNKASYNDDGYCVDAAAKRLAKQPARDRYLVVFSDGIPVPSAEHAGSEWELGNIIKSIRQKREVKMIGIGLGSGTEHVRGYYPASAVVPDVRELPRAMRELFADIVEHPESY